MTVLGPPSVGPYVVTTRAWVVWFSTCRVVGIWAGFETENHSQCVRMHVESIKRKQDRELRSSTLCSNQYFTDISFEFSFCRVLNCAGLCCIVETENVCGFLFHKIEVLKSADLNWAGTTVHVGCRVTTKWNPGHFTVV